MSTNGDNDTPSPVKEVLTTVYDESRLKHHERHTFLFLLHLFSWYETARSKHPLRVICIGEPKKIVRDAIEWAGAELRYVEDRHPLFPLGQCYNKHLALPTDTSERVFLTDNDTVYLEDTSPLFSDDFRKLQVSFAGRARISKEMWALLKDEFGAESVEVQWLPGAEHAEALIRNLPIEEQRFGYFQGGAIVFPKGVEFWNAWEAKSFELARFLEARGYDGQKTVGTDQASLSLTAADHGNWKQLSDSYNFCWYDYITKSIPSLGIRQLHLAGIGRVFGKLPRNEKASARRLLEGFWEDKILRSMKLMRKDEHYLTLAAENRDEVLSIVSQYDLDDLRQFSVPGAFPKLS